MPSAFFNPALLRLLFPTGNSQAGRAVSWPRLADSMAADGQVRVRLWAVSRGRCHQIQLAIDTGRFTGREGELRTPFCTQTLLIPRSVGLAFSVAIGAGPGKAHRTKRERSPHFSEPPTSSSRR